jgi:hypothetical protein
VLINFSNPDLDQYGEQRHKWQMPKMPKIKDGNHFIKKKVTVQPTAENAASSP